MRRYKTHNILNTVWKILLLSLDVTQVFTKQFFIILFKKKGQGIGKKVFLPKTTSTQATKQAEIAAAEKQLRDAEKKFYQAAFSKVNLGNFTKVHFELKLTFTATSVQLLTCGFFCCFVCGTL